MKTMAGGPNNVGIELTKEQLTKLEKRVKDKSNDHISWSNKFVECQKHGTNLITLYKVLQRKTASKKTLEKLSFIFDK